MQNTEHNPICFKTNLNSYVYAFVDHRAEQKKVNANLLTVFISRESGEWWHFFKSSILLTLFSEEKKGSRCEMCIFLGAECLPLGVTCNVSQVLYSRGFASPGLSYQQYWLSFANTYRKLLNKNRGWPRSSKSKLLPEKGKVSKQLRKAGYKLLLVFL